VCGQSKVIIYDFQDSFDNEPTILLTLNDVVPEISGTLADVDIALDKGKIVIQIINITGEIYKVFLSNNFELLFSKRYSSFGNLTNTRAIDFKKQHSKWYGFSIG